MVLRCSTTSGLSAGANVYEAPRAGIELVGEHDESESGQEELYYRRRGRRALHARRRHGRRTGRDRGRDHRPGRSACCDGSRGGYDGHGRGWASGRAFRVELATRSLRGRARAGGRIGAVALVGTKESFGNFIGGEWLDAEGGDTFESTSPATGERLGTPPVRRRGRRARRGRGEGRLPGLAARAGAASRRDPLPLRAPACTAQAGAGRAHGPRDGKGARRSGRRRPGSDRYELLHGGGGSAALRADDSVGAPNKPT